MVSGSGELGIGTSVHPRSWSGQEIFAIQCRRVLSKQIDLSLRALDSGGKVLDLWLSPKGKRLLLLLHRRLESPMTEKKKPDRIFRIGDVSCSIFLQNTGEDRTFRTVNLQKSYIDREGVRQYSSSLSLAEMPTAIEVLRMALNYVAGEEAFVDLA
jgi:hypothetical protein